VLLCGIQKKPKDKEEPCTALMNLRMPPSLLTKIKEKENWQEFVRQTLAEKLDIKSA
jgi:hypothetical protein